MHSSLTSPVSPFLRVAPTPPSQALKPVIDGMDGIKISQGLGLQDFDLIRVIGRGSYAKVLLVRLKKNDQVYAMKVVKKELVHDDEVSPAPARAPSAHPGEAHKTCPFNRVEVCTSLASSAFVMMRYLPSPLSGARRFSPPAGDPAALAVTAPRSEPPAATHGLPSAASPSWLFHMRGLGPCGRLCLASVAGRHVFGVHALAASITTPSSWLRRVSACGRPRPVLLAARRQTLAVVISVAGNVCVQDQPGSLCAGRWGLEWLGHGATVSLTA